MPEGRRGGAFRCRWPVPHEMVRIAVVEVEEMVERSIRIRNIRQRRESFRWPCSSPDLRPLETTILIEGNLLIL